MLKLIDARRRPRVARDSSTALARASAYAVTVVLTLLGTALTAMPAATPRQPQSPDPSPPVEATSLFGKPLIPPDPGADARARLDANLAAARERYEAAPDDADAIIWLGRRLGYLGRYRDAIDTFSEGIRKHPRDARMYRHRGHRYITVRQFARAIEDLEQAATLVAGTPDEVEPDGIPNARNTPTSTLQSNIWYHLGLARYLQGAFDPALEAYRECLDVSKNPDMLVATSHWLYMTLRRLERTDEATAVLEPIHPDLDVIENDAYHRLLLMYKGLEPIDSLLSAERGTLDDATLGYGVANWHFYNDRQDEAVAIWRRVLAGPQWASFGAIAAEADLHRLGIPP